MLRFFKADARGTVQLTDNDALGPVNHKATAWGHQRDFAHKECIFPQVFAFAKFEGYIQRSRKGFTLTNRLEIFHLGFFDFVAYEIEGNLPIVTLDRERLAEHRL